MGESTRRRPADRGPAEGRRARTEDVAALAGVPAMAVSRALSSPAKVRASTRARVLAAVRALDHRPNVAARVLVTGGSGVLGVAGFDTTRYGPASTVYGIEHFGEIGRHALGLLMDRIGRPAADGTPGRRLVGPELIVRETTAAVRA
ncbi:LacI family DNA-binding transcriptional regulator [Actinomadura sp. GC306]|uniref:LacI family DNA-binding transcriptional regulator n=1 Tax=Actinomadura sp. GC306 TaxID=2530367 RepID=UPI001053DD6E|nr:LacI family DNA-binding transcriptional regulator [Actinomadura sp. GC306]TDC62137.1 LacI family DNA-binding transcriptional regulator [Actinomadura sp. GC306]